MFYKIANKYTFMTKIYLDVVNEDVKPIAQKLMNSKLKQKGYEIEDNFKIPIVPEFEYDGDIDIPSLGPNQRFKVTGFTFYPDIEDPMIVMLDCSDEMVIQLWRDELITQIGKSNLTGYMKPPNITLFKAGDYGDEYEFRLNSEIRDNFLNDCDKFKFPGVIRAENIIVE